MWIAFSVQLVAYLSFIWAAVFFFKSTKLDKKNPSILLIQLFGTANIIFNLYQTSNLESDTFAISGVILLVLSIVIFWWALETNRSRPLAFAFSENKPGPIVTRGPYKIVRHPLYTSYSIAWIAGFMITKEILSLVFGIALIVLYVRAARAEEVELTSGEFGTAYTEYKKAVGMFTPKLFGRK